MLEHLYEQAGSTTTRRRVVKTGAKIVYAAPLVAASMHLAGSSVDAVSPVADFCGKSVGLNGGCKGACTAAGCTGNVCNDICGNGQVPGACPPGQGAENPCCNFGYCEPANFVCPAGTYIGPAC